MKKEKERRNIYFMENEKVFFTEKEIKAINNLIEEYKEFKGYCSTIFKSKSFNNAKKSKEFKQTINYFIKNLQKRNVESNVFMEKILEGTDLSALDFLEKIFIDAYIPLCDKDDCIDNILKELEWHMDETIQEWKKGYKKEAYITLTNTIFRMYKFRIAFKCLKRYYQVKHKMNIYTIIDNKLEKIYFTLGDILHICKDENKLKV